MSKVEHPSENALGVLIWIERKPEGIEISVKGHNPDGVKPLTPEEITRVMMHALAKELLEITRVQMGSVENPPPPGATLAQAMGHLHPHAVEELTRAWFNQFHDNLEEQRELGQTLQRVTLTNAMESLFGDRAGR